MLRWSQQRWRAINANSLHKLEYSAIERMAEQGIPAEQKLNDQFGNKLDFIELDRARDSGIKQ